MADACTLKELTPGQSQAYRAAVEIYQAFLEALGQSRAFKGGMHWKKIRGRDYLYRYRDRLGHGESLGPRSQQTEGAFLEFVRERREVAARLEKVRLRLLEQARFCRAARINRVPKAGARILRRLEQHETWGNLLVIGTAALSAYEFAAGVFLAPAPGPDLPGASPRRLTLAAAGEVSWEELLGVLRRTDRSFAALPGKECRAANRDGFLVTLLKTGDQGVGMRKAITVPGAREPLPPTAGDLHFLTASPKFSQVVIGIDGGPATMLVPDPRAFALNRLWLSRQEDRGESQRSRDYCQALAVARLVLGYLPQYDYFATELDMFPPDLGQGAARLAEGEEATEEVSEEY
jgi:hypothetical protein